jgi:hypothetical protein
LKYFLNARFLTKYPLAPSFVGRRSCCIVRTDRLYGIRGAYLYQK